MAANGRTSEPTKSIFFFSGAAFFDFLTSLVISLLIIAATCSTLSFVSFTSAFLRPLLAGSFASAFLRPLLAGSFTSALEAAVEVFLASFSALTSLSLASFITVSLVAFFGSFFSLSSAFLRPLLAGLVSSSAFLRPLLAGLASSSAFLRPLLAGLASSSAFLRPLFTGLTVSKTLLSFSSEALTSATGLISFTGAFASTAFGVSTFFSGKTITSDFSLTASFTAASAAVLSASLFLSFFPAILTSLYIWLQSPKENLSDSLSYLEYGVLINKERMSLAAA